MGLLSNVLVKLGLKKKPFRVRRVRTVPKDWHAQRAAIEAKQKNHYFEPDACEHVAKRHAEAKKAKPVQHGYGGSRSRAADDFFAPTSLTPSFDEPSFTANNLFNSTPSVPAYSGGGGGFDGGGSSSDWSSSDSGSGSSSSSSD